MVSALTLEVTNETMYHLDHRVQPLLRPAGRSAALP